MADQPTNERDDETRSGLRIVGAQSAARLIAGTTAVGSAVGTTVAADRDAAERDGSLNDDDDEIDDPTSEQLSWSDMADGTGMIDLARPVTDDDADDDFDFDDDGGGWMEAGEQTLGDVLGRHSNGQPVVAMTAGIAVALPEDLEQSDDLEDLPQPDISDVAAPADAPEMDDELIEPTAEAQRDALPQTVGQTSIDAVDETAAATDLGDLDNDLDLDDDVDDDVFPESMYRGSAARSVTFAPGEPDEPADQTVDRRASERRVAAKIELPGAESDVEPDVAAAPARRKAQAPPTAADVADGEGWTTFAKSGPRWRDEARDWKDVDAMDQSMLADDASRVGTLDPDRGAIADLYTFAEGDPRTPPQSPSLGSTSGASVVGLSKAADGKEAKGGGSAAANVVRIDALKSDDPADPSAGSQQRRSGQKRPAVASKATDRSRSTAPPARSAGLPERIATGLILALFVGFVFTVFETTGAAVLAGIAIIMAALELTNALRRRAFRPAIPVVALGLASVIAGGMFANARGVMVAIVLTVLATLMWYLFGVERERPTVNIAATLMAFIYPGIAAATAALMLDTKHGVGLITAAVACTVGHDVMAYFFGRFLGRRKLAPEISPNKTVEGLVGGVIGSIAVGGLLIGKVLSLAPWESVTRGIIVGVAVGIAAPLGDLVESQIKRDLDIKDMGTLLPGHGGVLDRIDGMLLAVPAVWLVATALQII